MDKNAALSLIGAEYVNARTVHGPMHSMHEGIAIIKEEFDELWDEVKEKNPDLDAVRKEARQLGAMALAFLTELT